MYLVRCPGGQLAESEQGQRFITFETFRSKDALPKFLAVLSLKMLNGQVGQITVRHLECRFGRVEILAGVTELRDVGCLGVIENALAIRAMHPAVSIRADAYTGSIK